MDLCAYCVDETSKMSQALNTTQMLILENQRTIEQALDTVPKDLSFEEHVDRARNNKTVMNMLIAKEALFVQPEGNVGRLRAKMMRNHHDRYVGGLHYGQWYIDTSNPQNPVAIKFTHDIQDALRPEAEAIARQNSIIRLQDMRISEREKELSSLFLR